MNHLPECTYEPAQIDMEQGIEWGGKPCICDRLRACEQRVLDAAREAVAALPPIVTEDPVVSPDGELGWRERVMTWICNKDHALAAIDALREKPSHDPLCPAYATQWQNSSCCPTCDPERTCHCDGLAKARTAARKEEQHTIERDWRTGQGFTNGLTQQDIEYLQEEFESCEQRVMYETCYALQAKVAHE